MNKKELNHKYYLDHKEEILAQSKIYHQKHKIHRNAMTKEWKEKLRAKLAKVIGSQCFVCKTFPKIPIYHKKDFRPHIGLTSKHSGESNPKYILEHKKDFVPLCRQCHKTLHRFEKFLKRFEQLLKLKEVRAQ